MGMSFLTIITLRLKSAILIFSLQAQEEVERKAEHLLEMPPVMEERQEINEVLEQNDELACYSESHYVFTDISTSVCDRVRKIKEKIYFRQICMVQGNNFSIMGNNQGSFMTKISKVNNSVMEHVRKSSITRITGLPCF